jgi:hypothetical protein
LNFIVPLKLARDGYYDRASTSSDPFHRQVATLIEDRAFRSFLPTDGPAVRMVRNWLRDEPQIETYPAESWIAVAAQRVEFAREQWTGSHKATLSLEVKQRLRHQAVLYVDVGVDVVSASVSLVTQREASGEKIQAIWKESRIWVMLGESRLDQGDLVNVTISSAKPISRPETVRITSARREILQPQSRLLVSV